MDAVVRHRVEDVRTLLRAGVNPNQQNYAGNTPLMELLLQGYSEYDLEYKDFREQPRLPYEYESNNDTPSPTLNGPPKKIKTPFDELFDMLLPLTDLSITNNHEDTALFLAIDNHLTEQIDALLLAGADISHKNSHHETAIHKLVNKAGADRYITILQSLTRHASPSLINAKDKSGYSALDGSVAYNNYRCAEHLLYKGATLTEAVLEMVKEIQDGPLIEVVEHLLHREDVLPDMKAHDLEVLFGVELEICVKLTPECAQLQTTKRMKSAIFQEKEWIELFTMFAKYILKRSPNAEKMLKRYGYMYVSGGEKYGASYILNLSTFAVEKMPDTQKIGYDKPFFTIDRSVVCGDFKPKPGFYDHKKDYMPAIEETFHIELVSPIHTDINELRELLEFLGMQKPSCFVANDTAGFHVNVSLRNKKTGKPIPLTSDYFTRTFFPRYKVWEAEVYPKVRPEIDMPYAKCIGDTDAEKYPALYHEICRYKYVSLHRKKPRELVEFRLFGSSANMSDLLNYTRMATELMRDTYLEWYSFYKPSLEKTAVNILKKELQLQKNLRTIQSRIRTRKTKGLVNKRESIQKTLRTLATLKEKNARTRRTVLKQISAQRTSVSGKSKRSKSPSPKTKKSSK